MKNLKVKFMGLAVAVLIIFFALVLSACAAKQDGWYDEDTFDYDITFYPNSDISWVTVTLDIGNDGRDVITDVYLTVKFYNKQNNVLATQEGYSSVFIEKGYYANVSIYFSSIIGEVDYCGLVEVACGYTDYSMWADGTVWYFILPAAFFVWLLLMCICNAKTRYYKHEGYEIKVRAGWRTHYIVINGERADEVITMMYFHINLHAHRENIDINVRIGNGFLGNTITTRINGVIVQPVSPK